MSFDARTLLIIGGFLCWLLAAAIEFQAVRPSGGRVMPDSWTLGLLAKGLGLNLISQRGLIPDVWTIAIANALLLASLLFFYAALQSIRGERVNRMLIAVMPLGLAIVLPVIGFSQEAFQARVFANMCAWTFGFLLACWAAVQAARAGYVAGALMILGANAVMAVLTLGFVGAVATREVSGVFAGSGIQLALYGIHNVCVIVSTFGYMDIVRASRARQGSRAEDTAKPDALTGLFSGMTFSRIGAGELVRARSRGLPVCAMVVSIDRLDELEAARGPDYAAAALKQVAAIVLREIRMYDVAGRLSPNVFGVLMPEMALAGALDVAGRIRANVASEQAGADGQGRVEISIGLCEAEGTSQDVDALMAVAGDHLDRAQVAGGNRIGSPAPPPAGGLATNPA